MSKLLLSVTVPEGFTAAGGAFGIKQSGAPDLAVIACERAARVAAMFTTNRAPSEATIVAKEHAAEGWCRAIVCNSGNANASTGKQGLADARKMCATVAKHLDCEVTQVLATSTGIIGHRLPMDRVVGGIETLCGQLTRGAEADEAAARGIMTTDLVPKAALREVKLSSGTVKLGGIAKGSGMIAPNMATMKAFMTTDADISPPLLRRALRAAVNADASFNRLSVDQHMSPSDTAAVLASGMSGTKAIRQAGRDYDRFAGALAELCQDLAYQIIQDGEGVTRVIRMKVRGASSDNEALAAARAIVNSPLVKSAVHGGDPNWGRIVTAAGYSGAKMDPVRTSLKIGDVKVFAKGTPQKFDVAKAETAMSQKEVVFTLDLGLGKGRCEMLGCDLSKEYVTINADYHT